MSHAKRHLKAAILGLAVAAPAARADNFHWLNQGNSIDVGIKPSLFLTDSNVASVDAFLSTASVKALKIENASPATINAIYNKYKIDYTFIDYEGAGSASRAAALVQQIKASSATGAAVSANKAFVSNFAAAPLFRDMTGPTTVNRASNYLSSGFNMASEELYPGSPSYRNPISGNSTAPNIRSALFTLPITRLSMTSAAMPAGHLHIPYVNRFNNWGNIDLDTDHNPANGYRFVTQNQLPSRGDFQAQVLHYRLRGADGVHGLDGGVEGYTDQQFEYDINKGWNSIAAINSVLADPNARKATLDTQIKTDGKYKSLEQAGVVYSGAYSLSQGKLVLLLSNLDEISHTLNLPTAIGGKMASKSDYQINAGSHEIIEFGASGSKWNFISANYVFADADRSGVGVPEPTSTGLITAMLTGLCMRRRRRA